MCANAVSVEFFICNRRAFSNWRKNVRSSAIQTTVNWSKKKTQKETLFSRRMCIILHVRIRFNVILLSAHKFVWRGRFHMTREYQQFVNKWLCSSGLFSFSANELWALGCESDYGNCIFVVQPNGEFSDERWNAGQYNRRYVVHVPILESINKVRLCRNDIFLNIGIYY